MGGTALNGEPGVAFRAPGWDGDSEIVANKEDCGFLVAFPPWFGSIRGFRVSYGRNKKLGTFAAQGYSDYRNEHQGGHHFDSWVGFPPLPSFAKCCCQQPLFIGS